MRKKMKKEMKSAVVMILSLALTGAVLTGCGGPPVPSGYTAGECSKCAPGDSAGYRCG